MTQRNAFFPLKTVPLKSLAYNPGKTLRIDTKLVMTSLWSGGGGDCHASLEGEAGNWLSLLICSTCSTFQAFSVNLHVLLCFT